MGNASFAAKLKNARVTAGFTQRDIYEKLGISQSTFSSWETGKSEPDADTLIKLCQYYGISSFSYFDDSAPQNTLTPRAYQIGRAYEVADPPVQRTVEVALEPYVSILSPLKDMKPQDTEISEELSILDAPRTRPLSHLPASAGTGVFLDENNYTDFLTPIK